ncbi:MAG: hypothetical protein AB8G86_12535 [Saprospiraceae bacterium]
MKEKIDILSIDDDAEKLNELVQKATTRAFEKSKALGLTITYAEDGVIYEEKANGKRKIVGKLEAIKNSDFSSKVIELK